MKHGMPKRNKHKGLRSHARRIQPRGSMTIAYRPGPEYGIGPSGGLMRGYGKAIMPTLAERIATVIGRRGA